MTSFDENVMYFKTILMVVWSLMLIGFGIAMNFYNLKQYRMVAKNVSTFPTVSYIALWIPIGADIFVDLSTAFDPKKMIPGGIVFLLVAMILLAAFSCVYVVSFYKITGECVELSCYEGYMPLNQQLDVETLETEFGQDASNVKKFRALLRVNRTDWFAIVNYTLLNNMIWAIASWNIVLMLVYIARVWCLYDDNINRGVDVSFAALFLIIATVLTAVYDWFMFWSYSHIAVAHYVSYAVYAASLMIEFNRIVGAEEAFTFIALTISVCLIVVKVIAGMRFRSIHMALKNKAD